MSGILRLESLTKGNTLKQGDKTPLKYRLFDADGEKLNIAGKSAKVRLVYPDFLTIGYEKDGLTVAQDDTVTFTIDNVIPSRIYHVEIIVDDQFIFPSRADEAKFTVDKSSLGTEANIIEIVGVDQIVNTVLGRVDADIGQAVTDINATNEAIQQAEQERVQGYQEIQQIIEDGVEPADRSLTTEKYAVGSVTPTEMKMNIGYFTPSRTFRINVDTINAKVIVESEAIVYNGISDYRIPVQSVDFPAGEHKDYFKYVFCDKDNGQIVIKSSTVKSLANEPRNLVFLFMVNAGRVSGPAWQVKINGVKNTIQEIEIPEMEIPEMEIPEKVRFAFLGTDLRINTTTRTISLDTGTHFSELGAYRFVNLEPITYPDTVARIICVDTDENKLVTYKWSEYPVEKNIIQLAVWNHAVGRLYTSTPERVYIDGVQYLGSQINAPIVPSRGSKWGGKTINFIGDSITAPSTSYASVVGNITGATIRNYGISNSTIVNFNDPMSERYVDMDDNADLVLVLASRNDYRHSRPIGTPEDTENSTFYGAVKQLFNGLSEKYPLKTVGIILPFKARVNQGDDGELKDSTWENAQGHVQEDYVNVLKEIAKEYAFPTFDLYNEGNFTSWNQTQRDTWFGDTIHPNSEGHKYLGQKVASWIETI